jgi:hypothetical protein
VRREALELASKVWRQLGAKTQGLCGDRMHEAEGFGVQK